MPRRTDSTSTTLNKETFSQIILAIVEILGESLAKKELPGVKVHDDRIRLSQAVRSKIHEADRKKEYRHHSFRHQGCRTISTLTVFEWLLGVVGKDCLCS